MRCHRRHFPPCRSRARLPRFELLEPRRALATLTWIGDVDQRWFTQVAGNTNWSGDQLPLPGDTLVFGPAGTGRIENDGPAGASYRVEFLAGGFTLAGNSITLAESTVDIRNHVGTNVIDLPLGVEHSEIHVASGTLRVTRPISGAPTSPASTFPGAALLKTGAGTLRLDSPNTFAGGFTLAEGTLEARHNGALGAGPLTVFQGTLVAGGGARSLPNPVRLAGDLTIGGSSNLTLNSGGIGGIDLLDGQRTIRVLNSTPSVFLDGSVRHGGLHKTGPGRLALNRANSFAAGLVLDGGTLSFGDDQAAGTGVLEVYAGTLQADGSRRVLPNAVILNGDVTFAGTRGLVLSGPIQLGNSSRTIHVASAAPTEWSGLVTGAGLEKSGSGTLMVTHPTNTFSGPLRVSQGVWEGTVPDGLPVDVAALATLRLAADQSRLGFLSGAGRVEAAAHVSLRLSSDSDETSDTQDSNDTSASEVSPFSGQLIVGGKLRLVGTPTSPAWRLQGADVQAAGLTLDQAHLAIDAATRLSVAGTARVERRDSPSRIDLEIGAKFSVAGPLELNDAVILSIDGSTTTGDTPAVGQFGGSPPNSLAPDLDWVLVELGPGSAIRGRGLDETGQLRGEGAIVTWTANTNHGAAQVPLDGTSQAIRYWTYAGGDGNDLALRPTPRVVGTPASDRFVVTWREDGGLSVQRNDEPEIHYPPDLGEGIGGSGLVEGGDGTVELRGGDEWAGGVPGGAMSASFPGDELWIVLSAPAIASLSDPEFAALQRFTTAPVGAEWQMLPLSGRAGATVREFERVVLAVFDGESRVELTSFLLRLPNRSRIQVGSSGDDQMVGTAGPDLLVGGAGDDTLQGLGGDDVLLGGPGQDVLLGGAANDRLLGGPGDDRLFGGSDEDHLHGGGGDDSLWGELGHDRLAGDAGRDWLDGGPDNDTLDGGADLDQVFGGAGADRMGIRDRDAEFDRVEGGTGFDDLEILGDGPVTLDQFDSVAQSIERILGRGLGLLGNDRDNRFDLSSLTFTSLSPLRYVDAGPGHDTLVGSPFADWLIGGDGDDLLVGHGGADRLEGQAGDDSLLAGLGNDTLDGGPGRDYLEGDGGNDIFWVRGDEFLEDRGPAPGDRPHGGANTDRIVNKGEAEVVLSQFDGALQSFEYWEGQGFGIVGTAGPDRIDLRTSPTRTDQYSASTLVLVSVPFIDGRLGDDILHGTNGRDLLRGGGGHDQLFGMHGDDTLQGGPGDDSLSGGSGVDWLHGDDGADLLTGGAGGDWFVFAADFLARDTITDFAYDWLDVSSYAIKWGDIEFSVEARGGSAEDDEVLPGIVARISVVDRKVLRFSGLRSAPGVSRWRF